MTEKAKVIVKKLEDQLARAIEYLEAIEALAKKYHDCENSRDNDFLFDTIYGALWDAVIIRIGTIRDKRADTASLHTLATELKKSSKTAAKLITSEIYAQTSPEMNKLNNWRNNIVAHTFGSLNEIEFDKNNAINVYEVRLELEKIENTLNAINK